MAKPAFPPSPPEEGPQRPDAAEAAPRAPAASPEEAAGQRWLDERIREQYQDAAREPLPDRLVSLIRRLRHLRH
ncbi:NepR family anti-sigma factor [Roseomonas sp. E05]|uniref:NepR family anti-sigma factor n=1 Tax=Roseomonas sp. E05 TaxID=3046310 RepID=UPI0024BB8295|nr:NepR family anti-sigma factor [Roseomonas sp. E05]MDJ0387175.1 NepR family anti-sigma factor [Roseomonas sp. E05]